jgi:RNA polymerase sigma-70 factor (ECF subfamily)
MIKTEPDKTLALLYRNHKQSTLSWIKSNFNIVGDDAEEIFQVAIIVLYDNIISGKLIFLTAEITTYLFAIIKNKIIQLNRVNARIAPIDATELLKEVIAEDDDDLDVKDIDKAMKSLELLGEPCKSLLELTYFHQMKMDEITEKLGYKNADTTKNLKYKCLKRLQKIFFE